MHIQIYSYEIKAKDLVKWKKITTEANKISQKFGMVDYERYADKNKNKFFVLEICKYKNKKDATSIQKKVRSEKRIKELEVELLKLVKEEDIEMYEYDHAK